MFILKTLDIFGKEASFNLNGNKKSRSVLGGMASTVFYGFVLWAIYHIGNDMIVKQQPKTIMSDSFSENPAPMILSPDTFTFAFGLRHPDSLKHYINDSIYTATAMHKQLVRVLNNQGKVDLQWKETILETERCTKEHFGSLASKFENLELDNLFCLKKVQPGLDQIRIQGVFESPLHEYVEVYVQECNTTAPNNKCAPEAELDKILLGGWFAAYYPNLAIDSKNYSYPNIRYRDSYFTTIGNWYFKEVTINLNHVEISTDSGWLLGDVEVNEYIGFDSVRENTNFRTDLEKIASLVITVSKITKYYERSYRKVQDIMADVDGLVTLFLVLASFVIGPYCDLKFYESLINELFDIQILKKMNNLKKDQRSGEKHDFLNKPLPTASKDTVNISLQDIERKESTLPGRGPSDDSSCDISQFPLKEDLSMDFNSTINQTLESTTQPKKAQVRKNSPQKRKITPFVEPNKRNFPHVSPKKFDQNGVLKKPTLQKPPTRMLESCEVSTLAEMQAILEDILMEKEGPQDKINEKAIVNGPETKKEQDQIKKILQDVNYIEKEIDPNRKKEEGSEEQIEEGINETIVLERAKKLPSKLSKNWNTIHITFWEYICSFVWRTPHLKEKMDIIKEGTRRIDERLDLFKVLKKFREIDKLKLLLLENEQFVLFDTLPKPELSSWKQETVLKRTKTFAQSQLKEAQFIAEKIREELIILSYSNLKKKHSKTMIDAKLLEMYDDLLAS